MEKHKKLKMHIRGNIWAFVYNFFAHREAKRHSVHTHSIKHENGTVEVLVEGPKDSLWKLLHWNKKGPVFCTVEEIRFQFIETY